jgi:DNA-binding response OmpR family regulator
MQDGKYVILCVDDDPDLLDALKMVLESQGYIAELAPTAEDGLRRYKECNPDLVIVDLMMEEVDAGTNLVRSLKAEGNTKPVYMLSSVGDNLNVTTDAAELGLAGVFQKPIDNNALLTILKSKLK